MHFLSAKCTIPNSLHALVQVNGNIALLENKDIRRNQKSLQNLCLYEVSFKEAIYTWKMLLVINPKQPKGPFWFLPHDDENSAFDAALYATHKYGGGFLAILNNDKRYYMKQDPNRNFSQSHTKEKSCKSQKYPSPKYTHIIFSIIEAYQKKGYPFLALHTNANSWRGGSGKGNVSILSHSRSVASYPAYKGITSYTTGLKDEDSLVYIAGTSAKPDREILNTLLSKGLNVKYEHVNRYNNDCSMSNYVVLQKTNKGYYNIEVEHGDTKTQKQMIDRLISHLNLHP